MPDLSTKAGQSLLEEAMGDSVLLILDNVSSLFRSIEENDADSWQEIQNWLLKLRRLGKAVLLIHHTLLQSLDLLGGVLFHVFLVWMAAVQFVYILYKS